ncbi:DNA polymerase III subunit delta [Porticoccus sp. W117]|uniref:DNA polymerase III subunit delta n=1 Tax=Porticoccus sp. W117 TaxID=3054777 RepID=UPI0025955814|nr:DNA polymerase III subunit delta [Porticoccus sp. W117]MDM3870678.1 DNA polymerase III subunit delta [Porticoccus sp. W117]
MKIKPEQLSRHLQQLAPVYLVYGEEPLLVQEACDAIRTAARAQGFNERELFHGEAGFDWNQLLTEANSLSLFADKKILELRIPTGKPGDKGSKAIQEYCQNASPDNLLLVIAPKLDAATQRGKWFKALESTGVAVQTWPVPANQLPRWIGQRLQQAGIKANNQAIEILADRVEGNLLAAVQEIEKLKLLVSDAEVDATTMSTVVADSARYNVFTLVDKILLGDAQSTARTLRGLREEGSEPPVILWALSREIRILLKASDAHRNGEPLERALKNAGVWDKRQPLYKQALRRLQGPQLRAMLRLCRNTDQAIKGLGRDDPWQNLTELVLNLSGTPALTGATIKLAVTP